MTIEQARNVIIKAFKDDPDFRRVYQDNIACVIMDHATDCDRNELADKILAHLFC